MDVGPVIENVGFKRKLNLSAWVVSLIYILLVDSCTQRAGCTDNGSRHDNIGSP